MQTLRLSEIMNREEMAQSLQRIAHEIAEKNDGTTNLALIGIRTRGIPRAQRLQSLQNDIKQTDIPLGELDITFYRDDLTRIGPMPVVGKTDIPFSIEEATIILVDDVIYTGRTIQAAMDELIFHHGRPAAIQLAVLIDRGHRELPIQADYVGKAVSTEGNDNVHVEVEEIDAADRVSVSPLEIKDSEGGE